MIIAFEKLHEKKIIYRDLKVFNSFWFSLKTSWSTSMAMQNLEISGYAKLILSTTI